MLVSGFALIFALAACSETTENEDQNNQEVEKAEKTAEEVTEDEVTSDDETKTADEDEKEVPTEEADDKEATSTDGLAAYTEGAVIEQEVDTDGLKPDVKTDNDHKRIMLLTSDDEQVMYKTIYVKQKKMLKIIDIKNDKGQVFQGTI